MPPNITIKPVIEDSEFAEKSNSKFWYLKVLPVAFIAMVAVAIFWKTVFLGVPLSKLGYMNEADSLFNPLMKSAYRFCKYDPSIYELAIPTQIFIKNIWLSGVIPLWSDLNGCGYPLIGDLQSFVFSPIRFFFNASDTYLYNFSLVLNFFVGALATYLLARQLNISKTASLLPAFVYTLCPYHLRNLELPSYNYLFPAIFLTFVWLAKAPSLTRSICTGIVCSLVVMSMHPECALFSIGFASLLSIILMANNDSQSDGKKLYIIRLIKPLKYIAITGAIAFTLATPVIFPFLEYMKNSFCYKVIDFDLKNYVVNWFSMVLNLLHPAYGVQSPFPGIIALSLVWITPFNKNNKIKAVAITTICATLFVTCFEFLTNLVSVKFLEWLIPIYAIPVVILGIALLSGGGLDELTINNKKEDTNKHTILIIALATIALIPAAILLLSSSITPGILTGGYVSGIAAHLNIDKGCLLINAIVAVVLICIIMTLSSRKYTKPALLSVALVIIGLNCFSQAKYSSQALPTMPRFEFKETDQIKFLKENKGRVVATGIHLFLADTNAAHGINDLRLSNPLFPNRYYEFIKAAGAVRHGYYLYCYHSPLKKLLNLASIKYVLSKAPVISENQQVSQHEQKINISKDNPVFFMRGLRLESGAIFYSAENQFLVVKPQLKIHHLVDKMYIIQPVLFDQFGKEIWSGLRQSIEAKFKNEHRQTFEFLMPTPASLDPGTILKPAIRIQTFSENKICPLVSPLEVIDTSVVLAEIQVPEIDRKDQQNSRFKYISENKDLVKLYENTEALPEAYIVHNAVNVSDGDESLKAIQAKTFDPRSHVVLEEQVDLDQNYNLQFKDSVKTTRPNNNSVDIELSTNKPGFLVLTDTYYPGWKAYVDGVETPILRANYLFRAIKIPQGEHTVKFTYVPSSFWLGVILSLSTLLISGLYLISRLIKRNK